ncbi:helix-turn-helix domain-containing protein [Lutimonas sp.]|uniref:AlbA family DNA-binding domain-containing protein n=1 Tax=Lutimonas sp. TaxID=1872403 RepID=UPI003C742750
MRKYILSIILVISGLVILIANYTSKNNPTYSESTFADQAQKFDQIFDLFTNQVKEHVFSIKNQYSDTLKIKDSISNKRTFLDLLNSNNSLNSVGLFQGDYKFVARKENSSFIFASDSLANFGVVKWQRFKGDKIISSWYESFDESIYNTPWYKELIEQSNQIKWYLRRKSKLNSPDEGQEFFYAGYSYLVNGIKTVLVFEFSKDNLFKEFNISSGKINPRLSFMNLDGKELHLNTEEEQKFGDSLQSQIIVDSLQINIARHFANFKEVPQGTFNFTYKNQIYWNSFKRLANDSGIQYYLYTVPNNQLISGNAIILGRLGLWIGLALMILGSFLLLIRKRFFYIPNRMKIPSVQEILKEEENRYLEFKSSLRWDYRQEKVNPELEKVIMKTIAAFGNTDGGMLLIGVDDDKNLLGLEKDFQTLKKTDADYYEVHLRNIMHKLMGVKYVSNYIRTEFEMVEDQKLICKIKVLSAKEPLYLKYKNKNGQVEEKFYVRSGNSSHEIESIAEINDYINSKFK